MSCVATTTEQLIAALEGTDWNVVQAARQLGMSRQALYRRMEKLGIKESPGRLPQ